MGQVRPEMDLPPQACYGYFRRTGALIRRQPGKDGSGAEPVRMAVAKAGKMDVALGNVRNKGRIYDILMSCFVW